MNVTVRSPPTPVRFEILETLDAREYSPELIEHYKSHVVPLLRKMIPGGQGIQMVILSDPPQLEFRKPAAARGL